MISVSPAQSLRGLVRESVVYGTGMVLARGLGLLLTPVLARVFDAREFGALDLLQTAVLLASLVLSLQMESALLRYYEEEPDRTLLVSTHLIAQLGIGLGFAVVAGAVGPTLARDYAGFDEGPAVMAAAAAVACALVYTHALIVLRAQRAAGEAAGVIALNTVLNVSGVVLLLTLGLGLAGVFAARAVSDGLCTVATVWRHRRLYAARFSWPWLARLLRFGAPLTPEGLLTFATAHVGKLLLLGYASLAEVGLLAVANRVAMGLKLVLSSFRQAWLPYAYSVARTPEAGEIYALAFRGYMRITLVLLVGFVLLSPELLLVLAGAGYVPARGLLGLIGAAAVIGGLPYLFNIGLLLAERTGLYTLGTAVSSATVVLTAWALVPRYGAMGAALSGLLGAIVLTVAVLGLAQRVRPIPYPMRSIAPFVIAVVAIGSLGTVDLTAVPLVVRAAAIATVAGLLGRDAVPREFLSRWLARRVA